jgi:hypothetical protein
MLPGSIARLIGSTPSRRCAAMLVALLMALAVPAAQAQSRPKASNDELSVDEGTTYSGSLNVLANDSNPGGDPLIAVLDDGPTFADTFSLDSNGFFSYTHDGSETKSDSFAYLACDGGNDEDDEDDAQCDRATVKISVNPVIAMDAVTRLSRVNAIVIYLFQVRRTGIAVVTMGRPAGV